jgi:hypothetical protein
MACDNNDAADEHVDLVTKSERFYIYTELFYDAFPLSGVTQEISQ